MGSVESVPSEYNLHPWYDQDDLLHIYGPEFSEHNVLTITDVDSGEVNRPGFRRHLGAIL